MLNDTIKNTIKSIPLAKEIYHRTLIYARSKMFKKEFDVFKSKDVDKRFDIQWSERYPCLGEKNSVTHFDFHYVYHTAWAARVLAKIMPKQHTDIS